MQQVKGHKGCPRRPSVAWFLPPLWLYLLELLPWLPSPQLHWLPASLQMWSDGLCPHIYCCYCFIKNSTLPSFPTVVQTSLSSGHPSVRLFQSELGTFPTYAALGLSIPLANLSSPEFLSDGARPISVSPVLAQGQPHCRTSINVYWMNCIPEISVHNKWIWSVLQALVCGLYLCDIIFWKSFWFIADDITFVPSSKQMFNVFKISELGELVPVLSPWASLLWACLCSFFRHRLWFHFSSQTPPENISYFGPCPTYWMINLFPGGL